jgi:hypothetical protein
MLLKTQTCGQIEGTACSQAIRDLGFHTAQKYKVMGPNCKMCTIPLPLLTSMGFLTKNQITSYDLGSLLHALL